jgi:acetyl-CoA acetyltransferase
VSKDEGIREGTTKEGISGCAGALPGGVITAGNASQFSDGAGACVVVSEVRVAQGPQAPGRFLALPWPAASLTRWASAPSLPFPRCSRSWA